MELKKSQDALNRIMDDVIPVELRKSAIPLIVGSGLRLDIVGTATLYRVADQHFLVTASHVLDDLSDRGLCVPASDGAFVRIYGTWQRSELFDIAVLSLSDAVVDKLGDYSFTGLHNVSLHETVAKGVFCLHGYPAVLSPGGDDANIDLALRPFEFKTYGYEGPTAAFPRYEPSLHLLLSAKDSDCTEFNGEPFKFRTWGGPGARWLDFEGLSGCAVWAIGSTSKAPEEWKRDDAKIVAVETGVFRQAEAIKTTRWIGVISILCKAFPELKPAISLWQASRM